MLTLAVILALSGALVYFWNHIIFFFQRSIIPFVRQTLGDMSGNVLGTIMAWLDDKVVLARNLLRTGCQWFKYNILGAKSTYEQISPNEIKITETIYIRDGNNVIEQKSLTTDKWENLPESVRKKMIDENLKNVEINELELLESKMTEKLREEGIDLTQSS